MLSHSLNPPSVILLLLFEGMFDQTSSVKEHILPPHYRFSKPTPNSTMHAEDTFADNYRRVRDPAKSLEGAAHAISRYRLKFGGHIAHTMPKEAADRVGKIQAGLRDLHKEVLEALKMAEVW
jgi:hypothetical protein